MTYWLRGIALGVLWFEAFLFLAGFGFTLAQDANLLPRRVAFMIGLVVAMIAALAVLTLL